MQTTFWDKNKVFLMGVLSAVLLAAQQFATTMEGGKEVDFKVLGLALGITAISFIAKNWRGQGMSIIGVLGNAAGAFMTVYDTGHITWSQLIFQLALTFGAAAMPDQKSRGYENTQVIKDAKIEGEQIVPATLTNAEIKKEAAATEPPSPTL